MKIAEEPMTPRERRQLAAIGLVGAVLFISAGSIFLPYLAWAASIVDQIKALF